MAVSIFQNEKASAAIKRKDAFNIDVGRTKAAREVIESTRGRAVGFEPAEDHIRAQIPGGGGRR